jgi:uncharacterized membrane protein YkoI
VLVVVTHIADNVPSKNRFAQLLAVDLDPTHPAARSMSSQNPSRTVFGASSNPTRKTHNMHRKITSVATAVAVIGALGGVAVASGATATRSAGGSRLDDGKQLLAQAKITEQQAIAAAQRAATGDLNEVDLEPWAGRLAFNVDVGSQEVKVDAETGKVLDVVNAD